MNERPIDRVLGWARDIGLNQTELANRLGVTPQDITNWKKRGMPPEHHAPAARLLGRTVELVLGIASAPVATAPGQDFIPIRRVQFKLAAGVSGFAVEYLNGDAPSIFFRADWLRSMNLRPDRVFAVKVTGRSMEPGLHDGDLVVVDTDNTTPDDGAVFAVNYEGELGIKRLKRDAGHWWLSSDNQDKVRFPDKVCGEGVYLIGRVVHKQSNHL
jgi:hypothetical protein